jgi:hypothetical protein
VYELPDDGKMKLALVLSYYAKGTEGRRHDYALIVEEKDWQDTGFAKWVPDSDSDAEQKNCALCRAVTEEICSTNILISSKPVKMICKRLKMGHKQMSLWMKYFREMDDDGSGAVDIYELIRYFSLNTSLWTLAEMVFSRFDADGNSTLDQCEYICGFTMFCGLDWGAMIEFFYKDFQVRGKDLTHEQLAKGLMQVHGGRESMLLEPVVQIFLSETCKYPLTLEAFKLYAKSIPTIMAPVFALQKRLRAKILGQDFWGEYSTEMGKWADNIKRRESAPRTTLLGYLTRTIERAKAQVELYIVECEDKRPEDEAAEAEVLLKGFSALLSPTRVGGKFNHKSGPRTSFVQTKLREEMAAGDLDRQMIEHLKRNLVKKSKKIPPKELQTLAEVEQAEEADDAEATKAEAEVAEVEDKEVEDKEEEASNGSKADAGSGDAEQTSTAHRDAQQAKEGASKGRGFPRRASTRRASTKPKIELSPKIVLQHFRNSEHSLEMLRGKVQHPDQIEYFEELVRNYKAQVSAVLQEVRAVVEQAVSGACIDARLLRKWVEQRRDTLTPVQNGLIFKAFEMKLKYMTAWKQKEPPRGRPNSWREMIFRYVHEP